jgi:S-adenosylmethionine:tRNA ribosyltransferase-isomerase
MTDSAAGAPAHPELPTEAFEYDLPPELIARFPAERRDDSRLLVLDAGQRTLSDRRFTDLVDYPAPGDVLVVNDTRVFPARLRGRKPSGAPAEILLLRPLGPATGERAAERWEALVRPGGKLKPGRRVVVADGFEVAIEDSATGGGRIVRLEGDEDPWSLVLKHGEVPLPPYIDRETEPDDRERYQTVYARHRGSVAAPTAGLHFTPRLLAALRAAGVSVVSITLHIGIGTFRPVDAPVPSAHALHAEPYAVSRDAARTLNEARERGGSVWAVGTTAARTLETIVTDKGRFTAGAGWTELFIYPPYDFRAVDRLLTNFHLPRSSLLMLVAAFAGYEPTMKAYEHAKRVRYRFYSYGDAMLVLG